MKPAAATLAGAIQDGVDHTRCAAMDRTRLVS